MPAPHRTATPKRPFPRAQYQLYGCCPHAHVPAAVRSSMITRMSTSQPPKLWTAIISFQLSGVLYIGWQLLLVVISLTKIFSGTVSGWEVTQRIAAATTPAAATAASPKTSPRGEAPTTLEHKAASDRSDRFSECSPLDRASSSPMAAAFSPLPSDRSMYYASPDSQSASKGGADISGKLDLM